LRRTTLDLDRVRILVNRYDGGRDAIKPQEWYFHPDPNVDVAVARYDIPPWVHIRQITLDLFATEMMRTGFIGIGDEVFFPGLFEIIPGERRNTPIVRHGAIAMLPEHPIQVGGGFAENYLVEARSFSGLSGSPVFVRATATKTERVEPGGRDMKMLLQVADMHLLGMIWGHWDEAHGVNMGIAAVTPAAKIHETLYLPEAVARRAELEAIFPKSTFPAPDRAE